MAVKQKSAPGQLFLLTRHCRVGNVTVMTDHPIKQYRTRHGMTLRVLASQLGVSEATVSRWETGRRRPSVALMHTVAKVTGVPLDSLRPDIFTSQEAVE